MCQNRLELNQAQNKLNNYSEIMWSTIVKVLKQVEGKQLYQVIIKSQLDRRKPHEGPLAQRRPAWNDCKETSNTAVIYKVTPAGKITCPMIMQG